MRAMALSVSWMPGSSPGMTSSFSRRDARARVVQEFCPSKNRGRRESRVPVAPAASCAKVESTRVSHHRFTGTPGLPCAMVLRLISRSPRGPGLFAPVVSVMRSIIANLTPASGRQDHTTSPSADQRLRQRAACVHRIPHPTSVTIAIRPSCEGGMAKDGEVICGRGKQKYFCKRGWTASR
jgi:hypothetical protein